MLKFWKRLFKKQEDALASNEWTEEQFVASLDQVMKEQEAANPEIREVHEKLSPEYQQIKQLIAQMLMTDPVLRDPVLKKIKAYEAKAVLPLLDILLSLDALSRGVLTDTEDPNSPKE